MRYITLMQVIPHGHSMRLGQRMALITTFRNDAELSKNKQQKRKGDVGLAWQNGTGILGMVIRAMAKMYPWEKNDSDV